MAQRLFASELTTYFIDLNLFQGVRHDPSYLYNFYADVSRVALSYEKTVYIIYAKRNIEEDIIEMLVNGNLARRNIIFIFVWRKGDISNKFRGLLQEAMRICVIKHPRRGTFNVYYNQAKPDGKRDLHLVNWWALKDGLYHTPLLPSADKVYQNFQRRIFNVPILHKPPWNFVNYNTNSSSGIEVEGGRDDKLLAIIGDKLNFRYEYFDPPDRSQGSSFVNGTMPGVLGLIWKKEVELFIGDLTVTYERSLGVEFSFLTLADSEAFITHAPGKLNEAFALVRPFHWQVWPLVLATVICSGPALYYILKLSDWINKNNSKKSMSDCVWLTTTIFLRQSAEFPIHTVKIRFLIVILYLASTYVIGDMYSANLTSMLARPARERPITTLDQLYHAMRYNEFQLLVERYSASHGILENGTGIYKKIWDKMQRQKVNFLNSTEEGMTEVRSKRNYALIGGVKTFDYDSRRFGIHNFHISEKLYTRYSAIALQIGCPFIQNFNKILMNLFEAGIFSKITQEEYQKLREKQLTERQTNEEETLTNANNKGKKEDDSKLTSMNMRLLQGAFYLLITGHVISGVIFSTEVLSIKKINQKEIIVINPHFVKKKQAFVYIP